MPSRTVHDAQNGGLVAIVHLKVLAVVVASAAATAATVTIEVATVVAAKVAMIKRLPSACNLSSRL